MHSLDCVPQYFQSSQNLEFSNSPLILTPVASYNSSDMLKPFFPVCGIVESGGTFVPDTVTNNKAYKGIYPALWDEVYNASKNYTNGVSGGANAAYTPGQAGNFGTYLYRRVTPGVEARARYDAGAAKVYAFWDMLDAATTQDLLIEKLQALYRDVALTTEKRYWLAPGSYHFPDLNPVTVAMDAALVTNPALYGFLCLELESQG